MEALSPLIQSHCECNDLENDFSYKAISKYDQEAELELQFTRISTMRQHFYP